MSAISHDLFRKATHATIRALNGRREGRTPNQTLPASPAEEAQLAAELARDSEDGLTEEQKKKIRGKADALALFQRHHNPDLHPAFAEIEAQTTFDSMEQARCESWGGRYMAGVRANLAASLTERCTMLGIADMQKREDMPAALALELLLREAFSAVTNQPGTSLPQSRALDAWRDFLPQEARQALADMARQQHHQGRFAQSGRNVLELCGLTETAGKDESDTPPSLEDETTENTEDEQKNSNNGEDEAGDEPENNDISQDSPQETDGQASRESLSSDEMEALLAEGERGDEQEAGPSDRAEERDMAKCCAPAYNIYTTEFDEAVQASELCDSDELDMLREQLDHRLEQTQGFVSRLAHRLQRRLMAQQQRKWFFDQEEGLLDAARLPRIISNPSLPLSYRREAEAEFRNTVVTLLIDNSGSMRGRPITTAALCGDIMARTLERCGVKVEVLGFTTRAWKGGQSRVKWSQNGRAPNPGRLNDLRHIIYKPADMPWRRARRNLGLMLREGLLKENIDGEALLWAWKRLKNRQEHRRILMVISDGAPVDDSTSSANHPDYLDQHLRQVISEVEADKSGELLAIGIGHDVTRYYANSVTISSADDLGDTMIAQLTALFAPARR